LTQYYIIPIFGGVHKRQFQNAPFLKSSQKAVIFDNPEIVW